jgi:PTS system mannose-specific IIB component
LGDTSHAPEHTLVLVRNPAAAAGLFSAGVHYAALNLGCLGSGPGRVRVRRQLHLAREELALLRDLGARGVRVTAQAIPSERPLQLEEIACRVLRAPSVT